MRTHDMPQTIEELLTLLSEESGEIVQECCKAKRFSLDDVSPCKGNSARERLTQEIGDLLALVYVATEADLLSPNELAEAMTQKFRKLPLNTSCAGRYAPSGKWSFLLMGCA